MEESLQSLIIKASSLLNKISSHQDYTALILKGYQPDLNIADAQTALTYLVGEIENDLIEKIKN